jgi:signal transduction histidine kinase
MSTDRGRVISVYLTQGSLGLLLMLWMTWQHRGEAASILGRLGADATILMVILIAFAAGLQLLKFELTNVIYVSLGIVAFMIMVPLLGTVLSSWTAVGVAIATRLMVMPNDDRRAEVAKAFGLFSTYGIPVVVAGWLYGAIGGELPVMHASPAAAVRIALASMALIFTNTLVMIRPQRAYGYSPRQIVKMDLIDISIYLVDVPFVVVMTLAYATIGWGAVLALGFTGVVANAVARSLAHTRSRSVQQIKRIASLTNIGKTISLRFDTDELLMTIYTECKKIVDCSLFTIALLDEQTNELVFELDVREGELLPKDRMPLGAGLNSWVVEHHEPLLINSVADEQRIGVKAVADTKPTESWLGVPMIARDRVVGVISVESFKKNAFSNDDLLLLTAIANQAGVAIENQRLYKDLEGLTYALEARVLERTNELRETNLRLLAADRSKNQFLANMSHELRTPLNSIIGFSGLLLENAREALQPRFYRFLENISTAGNHLLALINDILDLSKIEAGKMELRADEFDLRDTIASVERVMRGFAAEANVRITSRIGDDVPPRVRLDEGRLKQILFNLLSNAVKFSPRGGPVTIDASMSGADFVRIDVRDEGIGIPADELQRIFDEFYQTEEGRRARKGGTGLGLSLTRNFVELHHGRIDVQSTPGQGSTFTLILPVDYEKAGYNPRRYGEPHLHDHQAGLGPQG